MDKFIFGVGIGSFITSSVYLSSSWETWILPIFAVVLILISLVYPSEKPEITAKTGESK